jgi:restriction system protein
LEDKREVVDEQSLTLEEWLKIVLVPEEKRLVRVLDSRFPTDKHLKEYLETLETRTDEEIRALLKCFLISCGHLGIDRNTRQSLFHDKEKFKERVKNHSFFGRLLNLSECAHPWQGITWVIDLLPHWPQEAEQVLSAYLIAHCQFLPEARMDGLGDAHRIIRRRYFEHCLPVKEALLNLSPRDFEFLVAHLYRKQDYKITLTPRSKDGGIDIVAEKLTSRGNETLHIECKRYTGNIGVKIVREILGTLIVGKASRAVIVASSGFTKTARKEAEISRRIELIDVKELDADFRKHINVNWVEEISYFLVKEKSSL